jgi:hypothetical protein
MAGPGSSNPKKRKKGLLGCHSGWTRTRMVGPGPAKFIFNNNYYIILYNKKIKNSKEKGKNSKG